MTFLINKLLILLLLLLQIFLYRINAYLSFATTRTRTMQQQYHSQYVSTITTKITKINCNIKNINAFGLVVRNSINDNNDGNNDSNQFDMINLQQRIKQQQNQYIELFNHNFENDIVSTKNMIVHVIVYCSSTVENDNDTSNNNNDNVEIVGMHSIQYPLYSSSNKKDNSINKDDTKNYILAFESYNECNNFAQLLQNDCSNKNFQKPIVSTCNYNEIYNDCIVNNVYCKFVPSGFHLHPPTEIVSKLSYTPQQRSSSSTNNDDDNDDNDLDDDDDDDDMDEDNEDITQSQLNDKTRNDHKNEFDESWQ